MTMYALLYLWNIKYGYDVYITRKVYDHLNDVFENLGNVLTDHGNICKQSKI